MGTRLWSCIGALAFGAVSFAAGPFDVIWSGAKGDGTTKDTVAIQKAIDECTAAGGGEVVFPKGRYLTGSLAKGAHTLKLRNREDGTRLDRIVIVRKDINFDPAQALK